MRLVVRFLLILSLAVTPLALLAAPSGALAATDMVMQPDIDGAQHDHCCDDGAPHGGGTCPLALYVPPTPVMAAAPVSAGRLRHLPRKARLHGISPKVPKGPPRTVRL